MIELAQVVMGLRAELNRALADGADEELRFGVGPIELEVTVAVTREVSAGGKVKIWVVEANGTGKLGDVTTQRIKLTLDPKLTATGRRPEISGAAEPNER
ncbi:trypco2 family protein [Herbidospora yilanensis]|uniref:trypco2 family protein n=1 Tax=Herbidospora yilanensis TaxID=354426 RepID=UPI0007C75955|nr:trypco2 family protein [Herbidospora yilanensis]